MFTKILKISFFLILLFTSSCGIKKSWEESGQYTADKSLASTYVWKKKTMVDKECSMIVKTSKLKVKAAIKFIVKKHSYECPAVSAFPIELTHTDFQRWINEPTMTITS